MRKIYLLLGLILLLGIGLQLWGKWGMIDAQVSPPQNAKHVEQAQFLAAVDHGFVAKGVRYQDRSARDVMLVGTIKTLEEAAVEPPKDFAFTPKVASTILTDESPIPTDSNLSGETQDAINLVHQEAVRLHHEAVALQDDYNVLQKALAQETLSHRSEERRVGK